MIFKVEDIIGISDDNGYITCSDCMTSTDWDNIHPDEIINEYDVHRDDERIYICDECKKRLQ